MILKLSYPASLLTAQNVKQSNQIMRRLPENTQQDNLIWNQTL